MRFVSTCFALVSVLVLAVAGYAHVTLDTLRENVNTTPALDRVPNRPTDDDRAVDILLIGTDARTDAEGNPLPPETLRKLRTEHQAGVRTDTIIVLRLPRDGGPPRAVSIPRDSWVDVPNGGKDKINSAFNTAKQVERRRLRENGMADQARLERASDEAGRMALVQTVQDFTQIRVDHYAEVSLLGFYLLTEAIGGVEVCLNQATSDADAGANFAAGPQTVSGSEALSFVRQRKNLPRGDIDRIVRQQVFLGSALHKVLSAGTLTSPAKLNKLMDAVRKSVWLDPNLDILEFAQQARGLASGDVEFVTIPVVDINGRSEDGQSIVVVDVDEVREFVQGLVESEKVAEPGGVEGGSDGSGGGGAPAGRTAQQEEEPITAGETPCVN